MLRSTFVLKIARGGGPTYQAATKLNVPWEKGDLIAIGDPKLVSCFAFEPNSSTGALSTEDGDAKAHGK